MKNKRKKSRIVVCLCLLICFLTGTMMSYGAEGTGTSVSEAREGVVRIWVVGPDGSCFMGTGFGVGEPGEDADTFVTNWHVVTASGSYDYEDVEIYILLDDNTRILTYQDGTTSLEYGAKVPCEVLYAENEYPDVAVIRTEHPVKNVKTLSLQRVEPQQMIGKTVWTFGYPGSADIANQQWSEEEQAYSEWVKASVEVQSVFSGNISRCIPMESMGNTNCIDHSAHINGGNSGGPLVLDETGTVIGINTYGYGDLNGMEYNVSIYIDYAMDVLDELEISYTEGSESQGGGVVGIVLFAVAAIAVVVLIVVLRKKKQKSAASAPVTPNPVDSSPVAPTPIVPTPAVPVDQVPNRELGVLSELRLQGVLGTFAGRRFQLKEEVRIGRDPNRCNFLYPNETKGISGFHCVLRVERTPEGPVLMLTDVGSSCGTTINGKKIAPNTPHRLNVGDKICFGSVNEEFQITRKGGNV